MERELTGRQKKFVLEFYESGNAYKSAIAAGYAKATAKNAGKMLLENRGIKRALKKLTDDAEKAKIASGNEVMKYLTSVLRGEARETVIVPTPQGLGKAEKEPDQRTRIQAAREILKRYPAGDPDELETVKLLREAQVAKAQAEAELARLQLEEIRKQTAANLNITIVDNWDDDSEGGDGND